MRASRAPAVRHAPARAAPRSLSFPAWSCYRFPPGHAVPRCHLSVLRVGRRSARAPASPPAWWRWPPSWSWPRLRWPRAANAPAGGTAAAQATFPAQIPPGDRPGGRNDRREPDGCGTDQRQGLHALIVRPDTPTIAICATCPVRWPAARTVMTSCRGAKCVSGRRGGGRSAARGSSEGRHRVADCQDAINERAVTIDRGGCAPARSKHSVIARSETTLRSIHEHGP
jgi:hypothetical protein